MEPHGGDKFLSMHTVIRQSVVSPHTEHETSVLSNVSLDQEEQPQVDSTTHCDTHREETDRQRGLERERDTQSPARTASSGFNHTHCDMARERETQRAWKVERKLWQTMATVSIGAHA